MYKYRPLDKRCIRLLTLSPDSFDSDIHVSLTHVRLETHEPQPYEAISYAWGSIVRSHVVHVDTEDGQQSLSVTENLHSALQHLRDSSSHRTLWADAACINQSDKEERSQQVAMMADIYRSAAKVIVWLGPEANSSTAAIETLSTLASKIHVDWHFLTVSPVSEEDAESDWVDLTKVAPFDQETWSSIGWLLDRSWFSRLWILQEVKQARKGAVIICGDATVSWEDFRKAIFSLHRRPKPPDILLLGQKVRRAYLVTSVSGHASLRQILDRTKDAQCSDPRDKIYAVLNLVSEDERRGIQPDYTKSTSEVFRDLILTSTLGAKDLTLLTICELQDDRGELPSWVPNLSVPMRCEIIDNVAACWNSAAEARYSDGDASLIATGRCVGQILKVQQIFADDLLSLVGIGRQPLLRDIYAALKRLASWIRNQVGIDNFDRQLGIICRTLCCNDFSDTFEPVHEQSPEYQTTLQHFRTLVELMAEPTIDFLNSSGKFYVSHYYYGLNRSFIITEEGHVGMAPQTAHPGDFIVVFLGCQSPIVLRPRGDEGYLVVGEAYVHGLMTGEAFLGPLPTNWQRVWRYDETTRRRWDSFNDRGRSIWQIEDPRLGPLPEGWAEENHSEQHVYTLYRDIEEDYVTWKDPRMTAPALRTRNVELQEFRLV
ncbi:MAG: hypothetical protein LQ349_003787 [Xanthoria aureola]|nr:MAG: hypothetical protein LQ349_003787 [Xanthoria aureola]